MIYVQNFHHFTRIACLVVIFTCAGIQTRLQAQEKAGAEPATLEAIEAAYENEVGQASVKRLERIAQLAEKTSGEDGNYLWRVYFDTIISEERFAEAEGHAKKLIQSKNQPVDILALAEVTSILAMAKRGALDESITAVEKFISKPIPKMGDETVIPIHLRLGLTEAYLRTLVDAGRYDLALKAVNAILKAEPNDEVKTYLTHEKTALERVGKTVPGIKGTDVDGRAFDIAALRGKPVLILFWATWDDASEDHLEQVIALAESYKDKGLNVVAINVDRLREGVEPNDELAMDVRRFLIERNLLWKCLISESGDKDYARLLGVRYLPANILIDAQGVIRHVDRSPTGLTKALADVCK